MTGPRAHFGCILLGVLLGSAETWGARRLSLEVTGACPDAETLVGTGRGQGLAFVVDRSVVPWNVRVASSPRGAAQLSLFRDGRSVISRSIGGSDCRARAEAIVFVLQAHFLPLETVPLVVRRRAAAAAAPSAQPLWGFSGGVAGGVQHWPGAETVIAGQADLALRWRALVLRVVGAVGSTATQRRVDSDRLQLQRWSLRLALGWRWQPGRWWIQPAAGGGVEWLAVTAVDLNGEPSVARWRPLLGLDTCVGFRVAGPISLRAELAAAVYPAADAYMVGGPGEIGHSEWFGLSGTIGLQFDQGW